MVKTTIIALTLFVLLDCGAEKLLALPSDPWENLIPCTCDSATYCLTDQDYMKIIQYNIALKELGHD